MNRRHLIIGGATVAALGLGAAGLTVAQMGSSDDYAQAMVELRTPLTTRPDVHNLIRYATLAPSGHNAQPWRFRPAEGRIEILPDLARRTPVVDPDDHHLFVSLGCAAENLALASAATGLPGVVRFDPSGDGGGGGVVFDFERGPPDRSALFDAIPRRQSTRAVFDGRPVSPADLGLLAKAAAVPGVDLVLLTDRPRRVALRDLVLAGNSAQMADEAFLRELKSWLRFNPARALGTGDGLYSVASGNPVLPDWLGPLAFDWLSTASSQNDAYASQMRSSAGVAVFIGAKADPAHWVAVGQACQRFALQATALGLKQAFMNQPVEVADLRPQLASLLALPGRRPDIVMRFGYGAALPYSARRPVAAVRA
jgi:hypothetical protein